MSEKEEEYSAIVSHNVVVGDSHVFLKTEYWHNDTGRQSKHCNITSGTQSSLGLLAEYDKCLYIHLCN